MNAKHHTDISSSGLIQRTVDLYLREGDWDQHIESNESNLQKKIYTYVKRFKFIKKIWD